jgi:iron complex outermembrane receptor protein
MMDRKLLLGTTVIAGLAAAIAVTTPTVSMAQTAPTTTSQSDDDDTEVEALVVTGSRIKRTEFTSAAPVQVITAEQSSLEGLVDTAEILQQSSIATGSTQINNQLTGFVVDGGPGVNTVSLRGLGAQRTLVLLNGRRLGPAGIGGTVGPVDLNVIPSSIIERVEILKDGASSIYGSDAVAGVVNIITRTNLDGAELSISGNQAFEGSGGEQLRLNGAWGKTFDRGYVNIAADWYHQEALRRGDRDYTSCAADYLQRVDADGKPAGRIDFMGLDGNPKCYNLLNNVFQVQGYGGSFQYREAGITYPTTPGTQVAAGWGPAASTLIRAARAGAGTPESFPYANYDSPYYDNATVISPVDRYSLTGTFGFDLTDTIELYGEFMWNRRESQQDSVRQLFPSIAVTHPSVTSTFVVGGAGIPALFDPDGVAFPAPAVPTRLTPVIATPYTFEQSIDYSRAVVGLRGSFGEGFLSNWDWDIYTQFSHSDGEYTKDIIYQDRVYATTTGVGVACTPTATSDAGVVVGNVSGYSCGDLPAGGIPWFSARVLAGDFTDAERAFLFAKETSSTTYDTALVEASISGDLFTLPAGPVGAAFGISARREEINDQPGEVSRSYNIWGLTSSAVTKGDDQVWELFGELEVPIAKGLPGIESLTANISGRYSNYDSYGSGDTYKLGLNWQITDAWRIRATHGTSFRAPGLFEQYLGGQTGFLGQSSIDPCYGYDLLGGVRPNVIANCIAVGMPSGYQAAGTSSALVQSFGNTDLEAETSKATTLGVVWTPSFIDLSVAIDYFEIKVDDEVSKFGSANILFQCYNQDPADFGTSPFCSLFTRQMNPALPRYLEITNVRDDYTNIAEQINRGIDLTFRYEHEFDFGKFTLDGQFTWQLEDVTTLLLGGSQQDYNGTTNTYDGPDFTGNLNARFDRGDWTVFWGVDLYGKGSDTENFGGDIFRSTRYCTVACTSATGPQVYYKQYTEFTAYHDVSVRKKHDDWTFQAGILNVFDEAPPSQSAGQFRAGTAALNSFDMIGRRLFITVSKTW